MTHLELVDPTGGPVAASSRLAPRPQGLQGLTVGLLNNGKPNSDLLLAAVGRCLQRDCAAGELISFRKPSHATGAPDDIVNDMKARCHVVVAGIGD